MKFHLLLFCACLLGLISCQPDDDFTGSGESCPSEGLMDVFRNTDGREIFIYENGELFTNTNGVCTFELQYFDPDFLANNFLTNNEGTFIITDNDVLFPTKSTYFEDFEDAPGFSDLFLRSLNDTDLYWTGFTSQSPATPTPSDYVPLSRCIIEESCAFIDNTIELAQDPVDTTNTVLKFVCVPPAAGLEICKSSIISTLNFYPKDSEIWFEASYFIESGLPFSIADFENTFFAQNPGPRVVIRNNKFELENKFGVKLNYENETDVSVPQNEWCTLKLHLKYSDENDGIIELWQDGIPIISATGVNLPLVNSVQNKLETGVTASTIGCVLLMDNLRVSETPF